MRASQNGNIGYNPAGLYALGLTIIIIIIIRFRPDVEALRPNDVMEIVQGNPSQLKSRRLVLYYSGLTL